MSDGRARPPPPVGFGARAALVPITPAVNRALIPLLLLVSLLLPAAAVAQTSAVLRPKRLVHLFDFEERAMGNHEDLPMHWYVIGRPALTSDPNFHNHPLHQSRVRRSGFPAYTTVAFDTAHAYSGRHSFRIGLNGGNAGAFLEVGTLPAVPNSDYLVSALVRTEGLERASARVVAYYLDAQGRIIEPSRGTSAPVHGSNDWMTVSVRLPGEFSDAAWVGLELEVVQPLPSADSPLRGQQVVLQDVRGDAWFDDISVWQLPHVDLASQSPVGIVRGPEEPRFEVDVRDLTGRRLRAELIAYDHNHRVVDQMGRTVGAGAPMNWRWTPRLPAFGWYLLDLRVHEETPDSGMRGPVARTLSAVLWLPPRTPLAEGDRHRFGLSAEGVGDRELALVPTLLEATDLHRVVLSAWARETTIETLDERQDVLDEVLRRVLTRNRLASLSLSPIPQKLAGSPGVEAQTPLAVMQGDRGAWLPYLAPVLMRQGQRVRHWQIGRADEPEAFFHADLAAVLAAAASDVRALAPQPRLFLPWGVHHARRPELPADAVATLHVPPTVSVEAMADQLDEWRASRKPYWLDLAESPADEVRHEARAAGLALRMLHGWNAGAAGMTLTRPWTAAVEDRDALWPDPLLGVFTNVARHLAGRHLIGRLPLRDGVEAVVMDGEGGGLLVAWATGATPDRAELDLFLGSSPVVCDVWGNTSAVQPVAGRHRVPLSDAPVFITGIDAELAMFRAGFRIDSSFVESRQTPHDRTVVLRNPWPRTITGHLRFTGPAGWSVQPLRHSFSLSPGQEMRLPVQLTFPFSELAGEKELTAHADFTADQHYSIDLATPVELGLTDLEFDANLAVRPSATPGLSDVEVVCVISNSGTTTRSLSLFAHVPAQARQDRVLSNLQPGQTVIRRFRFPGLSAADRQSPMRTGVREVSGPAVLNRLLELDR